MKSSWQKLILLWLILTLFSSCATIGTNKTDATRTQTEGIIAGTLLGTGIGAGVGAILGGKKGAEKGAAIGGGVGLVSGLLAGKYVAGRKQLYVDMEENLDKRIIIAKNTNAHLRSYNDQTQKRITAIKKDIAQLKTLYKARKVNVKRLKQKQSDIRVSITNGEQQKKCMEEELNILNKYIASVDQKQQKKKTTQLQKEIDLLKMNIAMLDTNNKQMAKMSDSLAIRR